MQPDAPADLLATAAHWQQLPSWERAELGRSLRRLGWTYGEIRALIPVPKGTLAGWCRDITLSPEQVAAIKARTASRRDVGAQTRGTGRWRGSTSSRSAWEQTTVRRNARLYAGR